MSYATRDLFVEFRENSMHVLSGGQTIEIPLERLANGRLSPAGMEHATGRLREFFQLHGQTTPRVAYCAIPARGVTLRRLGVPAVAREESHRLLVMQLEAQLPISPNELAWGYSRLPKQNGSSNGSPALEEFLVVAVKKEFLEDYTRVLADSGLAAEYTLSALARWRLCARPPERFSILDAGVRPELASFDNRGAISLRVLPTSPAGLSEPLQKVPAASVGEKLYVTGGRESVESVARTVPFPVEKLDGAEMDGATPATLGLRQIIERGESPLFLGSHQPVTEKPVSAPWKWAAVAALLAVVALSLRYAEGAIYRARLSRKLAAIASYKSSLPTIEREFAFLNYLKTNQPPYLDVITILGLSAPPGVQVGSLSIIRQGDLSMRGQVSDPQAAATLRSKLIDSGFFARVVLDEQTPSPDGQKVTFRISAQLKPDAARKPLVVPAEAKASTTNAVENPASQNK